ncbi:MAG: hypothetical protein J6V41_05045 [Kiritimatiellae bacterium]|nr:hypothetical protein [Kiritimatiellia bacterium]
MKKIGLYFFCVVLHIFSIFSYAGNDDLIEKKYLVVCSHEGSGDTKAIAIENALRNAIKAIFGTKMSVEEEEFSSRISIGENEDFSSSFRRKVKERYGGKIRRYKIEKISKNEDGEFVAKLKILLDLREKEILKKIQKIQMTEVSMKTLVELRDMRKLVPEDSNPKIDENIVNAMVVGALVIDNQQLYKQIKENVVDFKYFVSKITRQCIYCNDEKIVDYKCERCRGSGICDRCYGHGSIRAATLGGSLGGAASVRCNPYCKDCNGTKKIQKNV